MRSCGWIDLAQHQASFDGSLPQPTFADISRLDYILVNPAMLQRCCAFKVSSQPETDHKSVWDASLDQDDVKGAWQLLAQSFEDAADRASLLFEKGPLPGSHRGRGSFKLRRVATNEPCVRRARPGEFPGRNPQSSSGKGYGKPGDWAH